MPLTVNVDIEGFIIFDSKLNASNLQFGVFFLEEEELQIVKTVNYYDDAMQIMQFRIT